VRVVLVDAGPLVALLDSRDKNHAWATATFDQLQLPLLTCDGVITEATFILCPGSAACEGLVEIVARAVVRSSFDLGEQIKPVRSLMTRYASVPMSFADACLVRMTELYSDVVLWTLDSDFRIYRRHGRQRIPTLMPK